MATKATAKTTKRSAAAKLPAALVEPSEALIEQGGSLRAMVLAEGKNPMALALAIGLVTVEDVADYVLTTLRVVGNSSWTYNGKRAS